MPGVIHPPVDSPAAARRAQRIRRILDWRFSLSALEAWKNNDPDWWHSRRNDMGRGLYGQAMRESQRLEAASEGELQAELADIALAYNKAVS